MSGRLQTASLPLALSRTRGRAVSQEEQGGRGTLLQEALGRIWSLLEKEQAEAQEWGGERLVGKGYRGGNVQVIFILFLFLCWYYVWVGGVSTLADAQRLLSSQCS